MTQIPQTMALKKKIEELKSQIAVMQAKIDKIDGNDEEKYRKKSEKLDKLRRDIRTLYLNKIYLDCIAGRDQRPHLEADDLTAELKSMEAHSKSLMSVFNLLVNRIRKEERIKYVFQKNMQEKPLILTIKQIEKEDLEKDLARKHDFLEDLKEKMGLDEDDGLEDILQEADGESFNQRKLKHLIDNLRYLLVSKQASG